MGEGPGGVRMSQAHGRACTNTWTRAWCVWEALWFLTMELVVQLAAEKKRAADTSRSQALKAWFLPLRSLDSETVEPWKDFKRRRACPVLCLETCSKKLKVCREPVVRLVAAVAADEGVSTQKALVGDISDIDSAVLSDQKGQE